MKRLSQKNHESIKYLKGFTLIEILLVMLLISILVVGINAVYRQAHTFWSRITETQPVYTQSRTVLDAIRQELSSVYLPQAQKNEEGQEPPALFSVKGGTEISFLTLNPAWNADTVISTPAKVTYTFQKSEETGILMRSEQPYSGEKAIGLESQQQIILRGLNDVTFMVLERDSDDAAWKDTFEGKDKPPRAVHLQLRWPKNQYRDDTVFHEVVPIMCSHSLSAEVACL
jgi:prepilin-type N-terminal cleavage/methylation domain-containing protein